MARDWETWLRNSIGPASSTEEQDRDRTEARIKDAIFSDARLAGKVRVFTQGSYATNTNVRRDSDVDIAVEWKSWSYITKTNDAAGLEWHQLGVHVGEDSGPTPDEYRRWIEEALTRAFGPSSVDTSGNKAVTVRRGTTTLDADVVPCFRHLRYVRPGRPPHEGIRLYPRRGLFIENWPAQNLANGRTKNTSTGRRYKELIRALKRLENDMLQSGKLRKAVAGFFLECLLYNIPDSYFQSSTYRQTTLDLLAELWRCIEDGEHLDWVEVNGLKWLWRDGQTWKPEDASVFAHAAWNYVRNE